MLDPIFIATLSGGISLIISVLFWNIRRSRCIHIETPCCKCDRTVMDIEEMKNDAANFPTNVSYTIKRICLCISKH